MDYTDEVAELITMELEDAQQCSVVDMIKYLFAFCLSGLNEDVPVCNDELLKAAFEEVKKIANANGTVLDTELSKFRKARKEEVMRNSFIRACNYALEALSGIQGVGGFPEYSEDDRIVFTRHDCWAVECDSHEGWFIPKFEVYQESWVRPDIVLLHWYNFEPWQGPFKDDSYSRSYKDSICVSKSMPLYDLSWRQVISTVEIKITGLPKSGEWVKDFSIGFEDLKEFPAYDSLEDDPEPEVFDGFLPDSTNDSQSSEGSTEWDTAETYYKREMSTKLPVNLQNGMYAAERLSCALDITHSLNFILRGSLLYITWSDRQSVIRTTGFDILDNLPHFLLVLLIIQRFDLARWGFLAEFEGSPIRPKWDSHSTYIIEATFEGDKTAHIFPTIDPVFDGSNSIGRTRNWAGGRWKTDEVIDTRDFEMVREGNDLILKVSWPHKSRASEVDYIKRASEIGKENVLVKDHIPTMLGHVDPPCLMCSTATIRRFLGLGTKGERVLRIILFRRLLWIKFLGPDDMLTAFLDCFFCHWALWDAGIEHGDISIRNLMFDPVTERGVLTFDLARWSTKNRKPSAEDNTGTLPFLALDLLTDAPFEGRMRRFYQHDAESFAWCLIYLYLRMGEDHHGQIKTLDHCLTHWFQDFTTCRDSKITLNDDGSLDYSPLHQNIRPLVLALFGYWMGRYHDQGKNTDSKEALSTEAKLSVRRKVPECFQQAGLSIGHEEIPKPEPDNELADRNGFKEVFHLFLSALPEISGSKEDTFIEMVSLVSALYPFVQYTEGEVQIV